MSFLTDLFGGGKGSPPAAPAAPNQADANASAAALVADQRAALLSSGGVTDMTVGLGVLTGTDLSSKTLTGA